MGERILERITIEGFKSIRSQTLELRRLNVFIGANGSGKSNLIEVFRLLAEFLDGRLSSFVQVKGGAGVLLHHGRKRTQSITLKFMFAGRSESREFSVELLATDDDRLEVRRQHAALGPPASLAGSIVPGQTDLVRDAAGLTPAFFHGFDTPELRLVYSDLSAARAYHFHDTSENALVKLTCDVDDNRHLRPQAENLAAFLYWMQQREPASFERIQATLRLVAPFFDRFELAPLKLNPSKIKLEWREKGSEAYFNAASMSDGTLRFLCLATLLLQPELPALVLLDEPELGLHPAAIVLLASLLRKAAERTQVLVATQSVPLIDQLTPEEVWTVDRENGESVFRHLATQDLSRWLDDYSLGELWQKNVLGARP